MTRAKDISKIITDADFSGTLDVTGTVTAGSVAISDDNNYSFGDGTTYIQGSGAADRLKFITNASEAMRIDSSGNVGIGTSSPTFATGGGLQVKGSAFTSVRVTSGGNTGIDFAQTTSGISYLYNRDNAGISFGTNNSERVRIDESGKVGIGTTDPDSQLTIGGNVITTLKPTVAISDTTNGGTMTLRGQSPVMFFDCTSGGVGKILTDGQGLEIKDGTLDSQGNVDFKVTSAGYLEATSASQVRLTLGSEGTAGSNSANWIRGNGTSLGFNSASGGYQWEIGGTERVRIDSSGNVGIGGTSFNPKLYVLNNNAGPFLTAANATAVFHGSVDIGKGGCIGFDFGASHTNYPVGMGYVIESQSGSTKGSLVFGTRSVTTDTAPTERMRIDSDGTALFGITSITDTPTYGGVYIQPDRSVGSTNSFAQMFIVHNSNHNHGLILKELQSSGQAIQFRNSSDSNVGSISTTNTATAYNTSSDHRLKENVTADWDATTRLKQLNPVRFNFIADADTTVDGFLAHEVQSVVPEAISGTHNEVDDDGNPVYQGIDQSKLVPLLVKTIQELEARIVALETA
jgi:hypothetical protein